MKYIDAEKLIAEIRKLCSESCISESDDYYEYAKSEIIDIIDSLQQDKETLMLEMCNQSFWEDSGYIMIPPDVTIEGIESLLKQVKKKLQQEQPEVDFEKEMDSYFNEHFSPCVDGTLISERTGMEIDGNDYDDIARHFYELGFNARKEEGK